MILYTIAIMTNARNKKPSFKYLHEYRYENKDDAVLKVKQLSKGNNIRYVVCKLHNYGD